MPEDRGLPVADLREELLSIRYQNGGRLTPEAVVTAAEPPDHPLHHHFTWNDEEAARRYRIVQARRLIRVVRVEFTNAEGERDTIRAFHSVPDPASGQRVYQPLEDIAEPDSVQGRILLRAMEMDWRALKRRYGRMASFMAMVRADVAEEEETAATGT